MRFYGVQPVGKCTQQLGVRTANLQERIYVIRLPTLQCQVTDEVCKVSLRTRRTNAS